MVRQLAAFQLNRGRGPTFQSSWTAGCRLVHLCEEDKVGGGLKSLRPECGPAKLCSRGQPCNNLYPVVVVVVVVCRCGRSVPGLKKAMIDSSCSREEISIEGRQPQ